MSVFRSYLSLLIFVFSIIVQTATAETLDKQSFGLRYTDNVYLTPDSRTADSYLLINSRFKFLVADHQDFNLKFDYAHYSKENSNDYAGLNLSTKLGTLRSADVLFRVFHKSYLNDNAATTDTSYTHSGLGLDLEKALKSSLDLSVTATASYEARVFHDFDGRQDHQVMGIIDADFMSSPRWTPYVYGDLGFVASSLAAYSTFFVDLGLGAKGPIDRGLLWLADLDIRNVTYLNRTVDQTVLLTRRRGLTQTTNVTDNEKTHSIKTSGGIRWSMNGNFDLESRLAITKQNSNNPNFTYQNNEVYFTLNYLP